MGNRLFTAVKQTAMALAAFVASPAFSADLYSQNFEVNPTASWTVNGGPSDEAANFFFDYSTVGIPNAPNALGTRGMKLQANQSSGIFGGMSVSPNGQNFGGISTVTFDWWANFNGPLPRWQRVHAIVDLRRGDERNAGPMARRHTRQIWFGATVDGNSSSDWRAYSPTAPTRYPDTAAASMQRGPFPAVATPATPTTQAWVTTQLRQRSLRSLLSNLVPRSSVRPVWSGTRLKSRWGC